ncbi:uncharacterized protein DC041_0006383, partial [Schistosoma bovis]
YQFITSSSSAAAAATHVTQTTPTVAKTITTDYKQYGCNAREINYKFNQLVCCYCAFSLYYHLCLFVMYKQ